jgi:hypothetical protein
MPRPISVSVVLAPVTDENVFDSSAMSSTILALELVVCFVDEELF